MLHLLPLSLLALVVQAIEHIITVGGDGVNAEFTPQWLAPVDIDDFVTFNFTTAGHAIVQTTLAAPCAFAGGGFASPASAAAGTTFTVQVTNISAPIFFACSSGAHCQDGAVGALNGAEFSSALLAAAITAPAGGFTSVPPNGTALGTGTLARVVTSPSRAAGNARLSPGAFVGIVLVALLLLIAAALVLRHWLVVTRVRRAHKRTAWKRRLEKRLSQVHAEAEGAPQPQAGGAEVQDVPRM